MSEAILDLDSISADETTSTDSLDGSADISTTVELFPEDTPTETSSDDSGHSESESAETFDPNAVDWARVDPNTVPEQYKPVQEAVKQQQADYTRKMQDLADQRRQQEAQQAELTNMQREWADRVQAVAPAPQQLDPVQQLRMQSTDEENKAMDFMDFYVEQRTQQKFNELEGRYNALLQRMEQSEAVIGPATQRMQQRERAEAVERTSSAVNEAVEAYGEDVRNPKWTPEMLRLMENDRNNNPHLNPLTDKPYTVKEAYEKAAGITASNAAELRASDKQTRRSSKNALRTNASVSASEDGSALTDNEVLSQLQGLGFE